MYIILSVCLIFRHLLQCAYFVIRLSETEKIYFIGNRACVSY